MANTSMVPPIFPAKLEEIGNATNRQRYTIGVIGYRQSGFLHAYVFVEAGFKVIYADTDLATVNNLAKGKTSFLVNDVERRVRHHLKNGLLKVAADIQTAASQSDIITIAIPAKMDEKRKVDYSDVENACKRAGAGLCRDSLVIVMLTTGLGVTDGLIKHTLENTSGLKAGTDFGLAYSPVKLSNKPALGTLADCSRIVAASDENCLNIASAVIGAISRKELRKAKKIGTAEVAALFEAVKQDTQTALRSELALFCEKAGVDYTEVTKLVNMHGNLTADASSLLDEESPHEPCLLIEEAENLNVRLRIPVVSAEINAEAPRRIVNLTKDAIRSSGKTLRRARISILGISRLRNARSPPKPIARNVAKLLEIAGAKVSLHDPYYSVDELGEMGRTFGKSFNEVVQGADCLLILTGHDQFKRINLDKLKATMKMPGALVDLEGIIEPDKVEKEGFIYRGLGRGIWTK